MDEIIALRQKGGDVIISFGGANGTELAMCHHDVDTLQAAYQSVIDRYQVTWVDFDIEGWAVGDRPSIDLRNKAIQGLQAANPELTVAFCLPALPSGLTHDALYVLENARDNGVRVDVVNVMAMDYGDWAAPTPEGNMGQYAIDAGDNTYQQALALGLNPLMGVTPMIGQNDVASERFYLSDAENLLSWAETTDWVVMLSMWSAGRDNGNCADKVWADPTCSGLAQAEFAFTDLFAGFNGSIGGNKSPLTTITSPLEGDTFDLGETVILSADATDPDGTIAQVAFFVDGVSLGVDADAPYSLSWEDVPEGACHNGKTWRAKWWTRGEEPGTTGQWGVWKEMGGCDGNAAPTVVITSPLDGDRFDSGETVILSADATDPDGTIAQVAFFVNGVFLGVDADAPYSLSWEDVPEGAHLITAVATDDRGAAGISLEFPTQ
ncbi:MAG: hypothetical protein B6240_03610 [Desulfobacteraceae bacterium 4572_87]|nr:MAG: hypothetical protein B6240_03610 [Desulfobacteraceae bacterium 4572_87]